MFFRSAGQRSFCKVRSSKLTGSKALFPLHSFAILHETVAAPGILCNSPIDRFFLNRHKQAEIFRVPSGPNCITFPEPRTNHGVGGRLCAHCVGKMRAQLLNKEESLH